MGADRTPSGGQGRPWRSSVYGIEVEVPVALASLREISADAGETDATRVNLTDGLTIDGAWLPAEASRVLEQRHEGTATPEHTVDAHPQLGYRFWSASHGLAVVSASGHRIDLAPGEAAPWRWQRLLLGRVLPWAAVLRGIEAFHASAVTIEDRAVALVGPSGIGKTSLALHLVLAGARLLTDDVLALDLDSNGQLRAHPGPASVGIRSAERVRLPPRQLRRLGELIEHDEKAWAQLPGIDGPRRLGAVVFVTRVGRAGNPPVRRHELDPTVLLGSTFVPSIDSPRRLENLLDLCATLARTVPIFQANVSPEVDAAALAQMIHRNVATPD